MQELWTDLEKKMFLCLLLDNNLNLEYKAFPFRFDKKILRIFVRMSSIFALVTYLVQESFINPILTIFYMSRLDNLYYLPRILHRLSFLGNF